METRTKVEPTKGPWEFTPKLTASENHRGFFIRAEKPTRNGKWALAEVQPGDEDGKLGEANARLIASAPELLDALRGLMWRFEPTPEDPDDDPDVARAREVIRKATEGSDDE